MHYKVFIAMLQANIALTLIDIMCWTFNGLPGMTYFILNVIFNVLLYIFVPIIPILWLLYVVFQITHDENRLKKLISFLFILFLINAAGAIASPFTDWFFNIDVLNVFNRGDFLWVHTLFSYFIIIYSLIFLLINRNLIEKRHYYSMLVFYIPPLVGTLIQTFVYGVSFNWSGMMLSLLILYFNIQDRGLNTDYLTGVYNRRQLDTYIKIKIRNCSEGRSFSAILLDLNKFKQINDEFGHDVGDEALQETVKIIKKCLRPNDFIARFGGDEFFIILDTNDHAMLERAVQRILKAVEKYNSISQKPYIISFSMGYDTYDYNSNMKSDDFFKHIDTLMYNNKRLMK